MTGKNRLLRYLLVAVLTGVVAILALTYFKHHTVTEIKKAKPPPSPPQTGFLYLGLVAPQSGPIAPLGASLVRGAELAVEHINASLGPEKRRFMLRVEDEAGSLPEKQSLGNDPRVSVIVGHVMERTLLRALPLYAKSGKPVILPVISDPGITNLGKGQFFRLMPSDTDEAQALAQFARDNLKVGTALVIHEDSQYGRGLSEAFTLVLEQSGMTDVEEVAYPEDPEALLDLAEKVATHKPQAVFLAVHARPAMYLVKALSQNGLKTSYLGTHALAMTDVVAFLDRLKSKAFVTLPFDANQVDKPGKNFVKNFEHIHHRFPNWLTVMTYDAVYLAAAAAEAGGGDAQKAQAWLETINGTDGVFNGLAGRYYFTPQGNGKGPIFVVPADQSLLGRVP